MFSDSENGGKNKDLKEVFTPHSQWLLLDSILRGSVWRPFHDIVPLLSSLTSHELPNLNPWRSNERKRGRVTRREGEGRPKLELGFREYREQRQCGYVMVTESYWEIQRYLRAYILPNRQKDVVCRSIHPILFLLLLPLSIFSNIDHVTSALLSYDPLHSTVY